MSGDPPRTVMPLQYAGPEPGRPERVMAQVCLWTGAAACLIGWGLIFVDTETVIGSGAVLFASGAGLFAFSLRLKCPLTMFLGMAHCALCALFVGLVNGLGWGPQASTVPFLIMGGIYNLAVSIPLTVLAQRRVRAIVPDLLSTARLAEDTP